MADIYVVGTDRALSFPRALAGALSDRPPAGEQRRVFLDLHARVFYLDTGVDWQPIGSSEAASSILQKLLTVDADDAGINATTLQSLAPSAFAGTNDARIPTQGENDALQGTSGVPSGTNRYVTDGDARNANARTPTAHKASHEPGGADALTALTDASVALANKDGTAAIPSLRTLGTGAQQAAAGNDTRLSDTRTPTTHNLFSDRHPDVDAADVPANGEVLTFDAGLGKWRASPAGSGGSVTPAATTATTSRTLTADEEFVLASGTITLTLPDASTARKDGYIIKNVGTGTVSIAPSAGDEIDGKASISTNVLYDAVQLRPAGADSWRITSPLQPETVVKPTGEFRAHISANQSIPHAAFTKINFDSVPRNADGWFIPFDATNAAATARYNPKRAGYYDFAAGCLYPAPVATSRAATTLFKNGAQVAHLDMKHTSSTLALFVGGSVVRVEANGTTDFFEVRAFHEFGVSKEINSLELQTYWYGGFAEEF